MKIIAVLRSVVGPWLMSAALALAASCAAGGSPRQAARADAPVGQRGSNTPGMVAPPSAPEADPENVEKRFGFAEAKARRERDARAAADARSQTSVEPLVPAAGGAPEHVHGAAGPGGEAAPAAGCDHACPCMKNMKNMKHDGHDGHDSHDGHDPHSAH